MKSVVLVLDGQFSRLEQFQVEYAPYLTLVWRLMNSDVEKLRERKLRAQL